MKSAGKSAHINCSPKGGEQTGVSDVFRYVLVNRDLQDPRFALCVLGRGLDQLLLGLSVVRPWGRILGSLGDQDIRKPSFVDPGTSARRRCDEYVSCIVLIIRWML